MTVLLIKRIGKRLDNWNNWLNFSEVRSTNREITLQLAKLTQQIGTTLNIWRSLLNFSESNWNIEAPVLLDISLLKVRNVELSGASRNLGMQSLLYYKELYSATFS